jgi:transposase
LAPHERRELKRMAASRTMKAREVRRTKVNLRLAAGQSYRAIMKQESCSQVFIARWKERFIKERLAGLYENFIPGKLFSINGIFSQQICSTVILIIAKVIAL